MEKQIKTIGVLTSGGDAPGMNAAVRAVVRTGLHKGYRMIGIQRGYNGLLNGECFEMNLRSVSNIISAGGTILYTARCLEFKTKEGQDRGAAKCRELGIDALVVIGGDGSYRGARELAHRGIPMIGLPGTIDNDIACTEYTIGYDTAMNTALEMIDKLRDTTQSHDRCSVVEVMGRNAGYIALNVAIASGAMAVLLPEKEFDMQHDILDKIVETQRTGKRHFIVIVAEGIGHSQEIANEIQARTGIDTRATILGHVQRGGSPTVRDRVNASLMGYHAIDLIDKGIYNRVVAVSGDKIVDYDVNVALSMHKTIDRDMIEDIGAVSYEVAKEMAEDVRRIIGTDIGVGVTGLAGPDGDGVHKVGTVFVSMATAEQTWVKELHLGEYRTRSFIRRMAGNHVYDMMRRYLSGLKVM